MKGIDIQDSGVIRSPTPKALQATRREPPLGQTGRRTPMDITDASQVIIYEQYHTE
jgi:hypothetical protein